MFDRTPKPNVAAEPVRNLMFILIIDGEPTDDNPLWAPLSKKLWEARREGKDAKIIHDWV